MSEEIHFRVSLACLFLESLDRVLYLTLSLCLRPYQVGETAKQDQHAETDRYGPVVREPANQPEDSDECEKRRRH